MRHGGPALSEENRAQNRSQSGSYGYSRYPPYSGYSGLIPA